MIIKKPGISIYTNPHKDLIYFVSKNGKICENENIRVRCIEFSSIPDSIIEKVQKRKNFNKINRDFLTLSIIAPKKIMKNAVDRNYFKRCVYNTMHQKLDIVNFVDKCFVVIAKRPTNYNITENIINLLKK